MPTHEVHMEMPSSVVLHSDVRFIVWSDGQKLGELLVSKGSVAWLPANHSTEFHLGWERFGAIAREQHGFTR
jgi:hypothetical protein